MNRIDAVGAPVAGPKQQAQAAKAGREFEAILLNNVFGGVQQAFTDLPGATKDQSNQAYSGLAMQELSSEIAREGGIGLGKLIAGSLLKSQQHQAKK